MNYNESKAVLWIVRHGKTLFNALEKVQGWSDTPLLPSGIEIIERLANGLEKIKFDAAYSSDSGRAIHTLKIILAKQPHLDYRSVQDERLREQYFGYYEGESDIILKKEIAELTKQTEKERLELSRPSTFVNQVAYLSNEKKHHPLIPIAENYEQLSKRLMTALTEIAKNHVNSTAHDPKPNILIVSHGVAIWTIWEYINNLEGYAGGGIKNGSVTKLHYFANGTFQIENPNDERYII